MKPAFADRVRETSATIGTGAYALDGPVLGFQPFAAIGDGSTCYYCAAMGADWEVGVGTLSAGALERTAILSSSAGGARIDWVAGVKEVFLTLPARVAAADPQDLSAIDVTIPIPNIIKVVLAGDWQDSDKGAWRHRCSHTSWENETLSGNWLGFCANEAAARAVSGATTGSYYYDTTAQGFYTLNAGSGKTVTYRGNARKMPAARKITVEAARVIIWDLTQLGCPMWMVFIGGTGRAVYGAMQAAVHMLNGEMIVAASGAGGGLAQIGFVRDYEFLRYSGTSEYNGARIAARNTGTTDFVTGTTGAIVNRAVNDVAMTVLPNAPVDVATGLPVPTIAVATDGGVSVINNDGTVADSQMAVAVRSVMFDAGGRLCYAKSASSAVFTADTYAADGFGQANGAETYNVATIPALNGGATGPQKRPIVALRAGFALGDEYVHATNKLCVAHENPATPAKGMVTYVTKDYNSGWQVGAIKGAWLADTVAETITGTELVTNGDFSAGTTGWAAVNSGSIAEAAGELTVTNGASGNGTAEQAITTVAGKTYTVKMTARIGTATPVYVVASTTSGGFNLGASSTTSASNVPVSLTFTATGTTTYIGLRNTAGSGLTGIYDNVSCRLADPDRSVKGKGLQIFGSLTKAAVASGAELMGYSGFSAANFAEQPYNSDLDFGTAAFSIFCPLKEAANSANEVVIERAYYTGGAYSGARIRLEVLAAGALKATFSDGTNTVTMTSSAAVDDATWKAGFIFGYDGTNFRLVGSGGTDLATATARGSVGSLTNANAVLRIGLGVDGNSPLTNGTMALPRPSATWPSVEQIKHIYDTERRLFEPGAQCTLAGSSNAVTALAYDEETDLLHVGTSYGRSVFKGLVLVASEVTAIGAITALSAHGGVIAQGGTNGADAYVPACHLREELTRGNEQAAAFGASLEPFNFTATAAQVIFTLAPGWVPVMVFQQGLLKREATSWTRSFDGSRWSAVLTTGATASDWISILAKRDQS